MDLKEILALLDIFIGKVHKLKQILAHYQSEELKSTPIKLKRSLC